MTREEMLNKFDTDFVPRMREILEARNTDYAKNEDALFNIKKNGYKGIIKHIEDKAVRLENIVDKNFEVARARIIVDDTTVDIANYAFLFWLLSIS